MGERYKGIMYPVEKTPHGVFQSGPDIDQIKSSMMTIIMTKPGERVMEPEFGVPLHEVDLSKPHELIVEDIRRKVAIGIKRWEKRIQLTQVEVMILRSERGFETNIRMSFLDPINMQETHMLTLQLPLGGL